MLYFLHQLSDSDKPSASPAAKRSLLDDLSDSQENIEAAPRASSDAPVKRPAERHYAVDSPVFNEAFSKTGLLKLPLAEEPKSIPYRRTEAARRPRESKAVDEEETSSGVVNHESAGSPATATTEKGSIMSPSESALLRDLPFTLQGLSSTNLSFASSSTLKLPDTLPVHLISLLHTLAEPSLLYKGLSEFVESSEGGLVGQSFRSALGLELRSYLGLVATLEGQIRRALAMLDESQPRHGLGKTGVTLKRCVIWTREATLGLRLMSLLVEESKGNGFGPLAHYGLR